ncbi:putative PfkB family kinase [Aspergillus pseudoustus]|uniref:PfkB family kinase n=1 Tax=Aspergillus pseudoustus TaxID=1810923 RepID=A0ABR4KDH8_9EURO
MTLHTHSMNATPTIFFLSLGLVVLDEIPLPGQQPLTNILGGSGAYATLGARLFLPTPSSSSIGWMLHVGNDFPENIQEMLVKWDVTLYTETEDEKPSTRGLLEYSDTTFGPKTFKYTTTPLHVSVDSLENSFLLASRAFHFLESPQNVTERVAELLARRAKFRTSDSREQEAPLIIWEPAPLACKAENLAACLRVIQDGIVDVFSPNHIELAKIFGEEPTSDKEKIEALALRILGSSASRKNVDIDSTSNQSGKGAKPLTLVVRAGEIGCLICTHLTKPTWLPPFYKPGPGGEHNPRVVDPTGAGNAFLGGYAVGYLDTGGCPLEAACYGTVAASFALEQVGMPLLEMSVSLSEEGEWWNGDSVLRRLGEYRRGVSGILRDTTNGI